MSDIKVVVGPAKIKTKVLTNPAIVANMAAYVAGGGGMDGEFVLCELSQNGDYEIDKLESDKVKIVIGSGVGFNVRRLGSRNSTLKVGTQKLIWFHLTPVSSIHFYSTSLGAEGIYVIGKFQTPDMVFSSNDYLDLFFIAVNMGVNQWVISPYGGGSGADVLIQEALTDYVQKVEGSSLVVDTEIAKIHEKDKDTYLAYGTPDQIDASEARAALDASHTKNYDDYVGFGDIFQTSAAEIRAAVDIAHTQGTDLVFAQGTEFEASADDIYTAISQSHVVNQDQKLDGGGQNEVSASAIKSAIDSLSGYFLKVGLSGGQKAVGGTGVTDKLQLQGTSGVGTATAAAIEFLCGNNGNVNAVTILNNGYVGLNNNSPSHAISIKQYADDKGIRIYGYDDKSTNYVDFNINSEGYGTFNCSNRFQWRVLSNLVAQTLTYRSSYAFDIYSSATLTKYLTFGNGSFGLCYKYEDNYLEFSNSIGNVFLTIKDKGTTADIAFNINHLFIAKTGNIGINTIIPAEKLDITGNINLTGVLKIDGVQVLKEQQEAISEILTDYDDFTTWAEATGAVNTLVVKIDEVIRMLRAHGLIATT